MPENGPAHGESWRGQSLCLGHKRVPSTPARRECFRLIRAISWPQKEAPPKRGKLAPITCDMSGPEGAARHRCSGRRAKESIVELPNFYGY